VRSSVAILGTGLIGTSIGLALRRPRRSGRPLRSTAAAKTKSEVQVVGWDARPSNSRAARRRGGIGSIAKTMEEAVSDADIVVIAVPLDAAIVLAPRVIKAAKRGALVLDVVPVKAQIIRAVKPALRTRPDVCYVSAHPMAGREKAGAAHADAALFAGRPFALVAPPAMTPLTSRKALRRAGALARALGAKPVTMSAAAHDRGVAASSALPQLASIALALAVAASGRPPAMLAGPGVKDATRLAASPFSIWRPALIANRREILRCLGALGRVIGDVSKAARQGDVRALERLFSDAKAARKRVVGA
jgi:prephenate dehydrogenase